ncbi:hypothetical protein EVAR_87554_1 [Eumeta japonica]|uniref:Uncharacterized protein n=1 Tax=Eumeta variegata TaxID=151549 RepID=A0A4C1XQ05_EUMVA|nr:hypothetical protein EVAR_87554_1 [Eumeta japonica]
MTRRPASVGAVLRPPLTFTRVDSETGGRKGRGNRRGRKNITFELQDVSLRTEIGRPLKDFQSLSEQQKRKRVENLLKNYSHAELAYAARLSLHAAGHRDASGIVKEITETCPKRANKMKKAYHSPRVQAHEYPPEEALPLSM